MLAGAASPAPGAGVPGWGGDVIGSSARLAVFRLTAADGVARITDDPCRVIDTSVATAAAPAVAVGARGSVAAGAGVGAGTGTGAGASRALERTECGGTLHSVAIMVTMSLVLLQC